MKLLAPFVLMIAALASVVWLDDTPPEADLVFVNQNEVFTLDPQRMSYIQDLRLAHALYEGLMRWHNADFSILPAGAAEMPEISDDRLRYTFTMRDDARWSNGAPVTAHDFVYSWKRAILPDTAADYSNVFFAIEGAEAFFHWRLAMTTGFTAEPWAEGTTPDAGAIIAVADRLAALLAEPTLPPGLPEPGPEARAAIAREVERLREAANEPGASFEARLRAALARAPASAAWHRSLQEAGRSARAAEAAWMWQAAERRFAETVGLRALDDRTLEIRLALPTAYLLDLLCFGVFFPVHRPTVEGWPEHHPVPEAGWHAGPVPSFDECAWVGLDPASGKLEQKHEWAKPGRHVGNGPFRLAEWRYKRDLRLVRSASYAGDQAARCDSVLAITIEDTNTAVLAFESGRVDWLVDVSADYQADMLAELEVYTDRHRAELDSLRAAGLDHDDAIAQLPPPRDGERRNIHKFPTFGTDFYSFNCRPEHDGKPNPFANPAVRRAFVMSVDKKTIVENVTRLKEPVATTLIPPGSIEGYRSPAGLPHDVERARAELRSAGWEDRDGDGFVEDARRKPFPVVKLLYSTNVPRYKWISLELKSQWERELGVRVELYGEETKFYKEDLKRGNFMIARGRWYGDYGDPTTFLDLNRTHDGNNDRKYSSRFVDETLARAAREPDPEKRMRLLEAVEAKLMDEDVPILVLCQLVQVYMYEPGRMRGLSDHPRLTQMLWQMEVEEP
jgi:ABC-type oligopeptide transport system substrate-binding subunit